MRPANYRDKLKRMQNHVSCLQSRANQLLREQNSAQIQVDVFEGLVCVRDVWAAVLKAVLRPGWDCDDDAAQEGADEALQQLLAERSQAPEHVLQQLPLLPALSHVDRAMHASIMQLDPNQAAKQWVAYTSDTMQLLVLHELEPQIAAPLLSAHITHVIGWLLAFYYFNTNVAFQLHNVNLLTRKSEPPPDNHWQHAFEAADMTQQQRQQIALANQFCEARLRQLQLEQQQLLQQMAKLHKGGGSDEEGGEAPSLAATTQPGTPSFSAGFDDVVEEGTVSLEVPLGPAAVAFSAGIKVEEAAAALAPAVLAGGTDIKTAGGSLVPSSVATDAGTDVFAWGPSSDGGSSGSSSGSGSGSGSASPRDSSNHARQHLLAKASELTQKISANCSAWRTLTSMRAQYSAAVLTPLQLARMMTAAAPYLLIGAPIYDSVIATNPNAPPPKKRGA